MHLFLKKETTFRDGTKRDFSIIFYAFSYFVPIQRRKQCKPNFWRKNGFLKGGGEFRKIHVLLKLKNVFIIGARSRLLLDILEEDELEIYIPDFSIHLVHLLLELIYAGTVCVNQVV